MTRPPYCGRVHLWDTEFDLEAQACGDSVSGEKEERGATKGSPGVVELLPRQRTPQTKTV